MFANSLQVQGLAGWLLRYLPEDCVELVKRYRMATAVLFSHWPASPGLLTL